MQINIISRNNLILTINFQSVTQLTFYFPEAINILIPKYKHTKLHIHSLEKDQLPKKLIFFFLVHQPAATNSIQLQSTRCSRLPHIFSTSSQICTWNATGGVRLSSFEEAINMLILLVFFAGELRR